jgi:hypothetical protein
MIKTSCFKVSKDNEHTISIARNDFPWSIKGYKFEKYSDLIPSLSLLRAWRAGKMTKKDYKKRYYLPCIPCINFVFIITQSFGCDVEINHVKFP